MSDFHLERLLQRARELRVQVEARPGAGATLRWSGQERVVDGGIRFPGRSPASLALCWNKHATKELLSGLGLVVPRGLRFRDPQDPAVARFLAEVQPCVAKPEEGMGGEGVGMGLRDVASLSAHHARHPGLGEWWLLEEQVAGRDLRMHVIGDRIVAACERVPAYVVGDGARSLAELVEARRAQMAGQNPENRLNIDTSAQTLLASQGLDLRDVPAAGQHVQLAQVSNISLGGVPVDVCDQLHPRYHQWAAAVAAALDLPVFGLDVLAQDPSLDPVESGAVCLEINGEPDWLHHTFSERRQHDMARMLLEMMFGPLPGEA